MFEISVSYSENIDRVIKALKEVGEEIIADPGYKDLILSRWRFRVLIVLQILQWLSGQDKTQPIKQWYVERDEPPVRKFERRDPIALPHRALYFDEMSKPFPLKLEGCLRKFRKKMRPETSH